MNISKKKEILLLIPIFMWVMTVTIAGYLMQIHSSWVYGIMVPIFFIMGGQIKQKLKIVTGGAMTGLIVSYLLCIAIPALSGIIGEKLGWIVPVTLVVAALMLLRPLFPYVCNNVAFLYMVIATKDAATFFAEFWSLLGLFVVGGIIYLGGILLILKMLQKRAAKKAQIK